MADVLVKALEEIAGKLTTQSGQTRCLEEIFIAEISGEFLPLVKKRFKEASLRKGSTVQFAPPAQTLQAVQRAQNQESRTSTQHFGQSSNSQYPDRPGISLPALNDMPRDTPIMHTGSPSLMTPRALPSSSKNQKRYTSTGYHLNNGVSVLIHDCDITKLRVDAVVNAANVNLQHGGGLSKIIALAAGHD